MKPRFFHFRAPMRGVVYLDSKEVIRRYSYEPDEQSQKGGATIYVEPVSDDGSIVKLQTAFCSPKDAFSRKIGRSTCQKAPVVEATREELPNIFALAYEQMLHIQHIPARHREVPDFYNVVKLFTPKG